MDATFVAISIGWDEALLRFAVAFLLPLLIGLERYFRSKPIDFRPFVIISLAACALAFAGIELGERATDPQVRVDPTRIFEGVITGIGFLGGAAMFREGRYVKGAGSAASVWAAGAIGTLAGAGFLAIAVALGVTVLLLLLISGPFIDKYDPGEGPD
ncbi:MgtC/SapB family protein [Sphingomonas parva]|uniref:Protein MgtC n=1 Tax=Sphingomonas parva TaxID=2555898 RepID=A0A4Y8ZNL3_9SPHN|nr:MgtC/SapB family protein [Sphingomonas parva]TFI57591.1 MgtC/SapB family protein [Sphingomonas parva]